ncbi:DUF3267 domain-containing protein [Bacillus sp. Hm123]|uniref:DUF3267 domain-containing protein n=1 Tax=Bacillus sp. Hm123 TaxID=3450745 RepID=UPI003F430493
MKENRDLTIGEYSGVQMIIAELASILFSLILISLFSDHSRFQWILNQLCNFENIQEEINNFSTFLSYNIKPIFIGIVTSLIFTYIHEYSHNLLARKFDCKTTVKIRFLGLSAKCEFEKEDKIKKFPFIIIALTPFIILTPIFILLLGVTSGVYFYVLCIVVLIKVEGFVVDVLMAFEALKKCEQNDSLQYIGDLKFKIVRHEN